MDSITAYDQLLYRIKSDPSLSEQQRSALISATLARLNDQHLQAFIQMLVDSDQLSEQLEEYNNDTTSC